MAIPIELVRGEERMTVYSAAKLALAEADGWRRVSELTSHQQAELERREAAPWKGYDDMNVEQVLARVVALGLDARRADVLAYERANKERRGVIEGLGGTVQAQAAPIPAVRVPLPAASVEQQLEAETGRDFVKTSDNPPTFVETGKPA